MIKERYCSSEVSRLLREKGFDEACTRLYYNDDLEFVNDNVYGRVLRNSSIANKDFITAPTHQMACDWLREVHGIYITIVYGDYPSLNKVFWTPQIDSLKGFDLPDDFYKEYDEYGEACEAALKYVLENLVLYEGVDS